MKAGQRLKRHGVTLACILWGALLIFGCSSSPPTAVQEGRALAALSLDVVRLLPAAAVSPPPMVGRVEDEGLSRSKSFSIGTTSHGRLVHGVALPMDHSALRPRPVSLRRRAVHGTRELIAALERVATRVARRWPGSVLFVGDVSAEQGGDIPHHASHNSGRDVDLAFYMRDAGGRIRDGADFLVIDLEGQARDGTRFDVARNWAVVEALVRDPQVQVQWIFVASHLRRMMLEHARDQGVGSRVLERARRVLLQPRDSAPHDDHFHVRIYCSEHERLQGCLNNGAIHAWVDAHDAALAERIGHVLPFLKSASVEEISYAITQIVRVRARQAAPHLAPLEAHPDPTIAALAADARGFLRGERTPPRWAHLTEEEVWE